MHTYYRSLKFLYHLHACNLCINHGYVSKVALGIVPTCGYKCINYAWMMQKMRQLTYNVYDMHSNLLQ